MAQREAARLLRSLATVRINTATHAAGVRRSPQFRRYLRGLGSGRGRCASIAAELLSSHDQRARDAAAAYPGCPPAALRDTLGMPARPAEMVGSRLDAADIDPMLRCRAAGQALTPPILLPLLATDSAYSVRLAVASNPAASAQTIESLTNDAETLVAEAAAVNTARGDNAATDDALRRAVEAETDRLRYTDSWGECTSSAAETGDFYHPDPDVFACVDDYLSGLLGPYADSRTYDTAKELLRAAISEAFAQDAEDAHNQ